MTWTLERAANRRRYGATRHVIDSVTNVTSHFPGGYFDLILFNGVLGWGLNRVDEAHAALGNLAQVLAPRGVMMVGWNDHPGHRVIDPDENLGTALTRWTFPSWATSRRSVPGPLRHTYSFFSRT